jgi:phosphatidylinositol alpha-mannosyltransferase
MVNILFLGRHEKRKGLRYLLKAFEQVKASRPNTRLIIVGGFDERQRRSYVRWLSDKHVKDVIFAGFVPLETLPRYHHSSHIYCAPNTGNESQGIVLLEAMAAGLPVIASNIDGFAGVITDGVDGLLVRPKDVDALARTIIRLVDDPALREQLSKLGSERAQHFSWERVSRRVLSYYERLLYEKQNGPHAVADPNLVEVVE